MMRKELVMLLVGIMVLVGGGSLLLVARAYRQDVPAVAANASVSAPASTPIPLPTTDFFFNGPAFAPVSLRSTLEGITHPNYDNPHHQVFMQGGEFEARTTQNGFPNFLIAVVNQGPLIRSLVIELTQPNGWDDYPVLWAAPDVNTLEGTKAKSLPVLANNLDGVFWDTGPLAAGATRDVQIVAKPTLPGHHPLDLIAYANTMPDGSGGRMADPETLINRGGVLRWDGLIAPQIDHGH